MLRLYTTLIFLFLSSTLALAQLTITGTVVSKEDNSPIPGVNVIEKGTRNGTITDLDGKFSIIVLDLNTTLIFSFVGMVTQEVPLKGQTEIKVEVKWDCNKDFFDSRQIDLNFSSGVINTPIGGLIEVSSPYLGSGIIKGEFRYQSNLDGNHLQIGELEMNHFITNCDFDIDFRFSSRIFNYNHNMEANSFSLEGDFNLSRSSFTVGYSNLSFDGIEQPTNTSGLIFGYGNVFFIRPLLVRIIGKMAIYSERIEYQASAKTNYKKFNLEMSYYKLNSFNEFSLGLGYTLWY